MRRRVTPSANPPYGSLPSEAAYFVTGVALDIALAAFSFAAGRIAQAVLAQM